MKKKQHFNEEKKIYERTKKLMEKKKRNIRYEKLVRGALIQKPITKCEMNIFRKTEKNVIFLLLYGNLDCSM